jgi:hypothetical protein
MKLYILILLVITAVNAIEKSYSIYIEPENPEEPWKFIPTNDPYDIIITHKRSPPYFLPPYDDYKKI